MNISEFFASRTNRSDFYQVEYINREGDVVVGLVRASNDEQAFEVVRRQSVRPTRIISRPMGA